MGLSYHYFELLFILLFIFSAGVATKGKQKGERQAQLLSLWQNHQHEQPRNLAKGTKRQEILKSQKFFRGEENIPSQEKNTEDEIPIHLPKEERQQGRTLVSMAIPTSFPMAESK